MAGDGPVESSGAKIFSHQPKQSLTLALNGRSTPEIVVFLFHTDNKPELEPPVQIRD